jgi:hypothetical protein
MFNGRIRKRVKKPIGSAKKVPPEGREGRQDD